MSPASPTRIEAQQAAKVCFDVYRLGQEVMAHVRAVNDFQQVIRVRLGKRPDRLPKIGEFCADVELAGRDVLQDAPRLLWMFDSLVARGCDWDQVSSELEKQRVNPVRLWGEILEIWGNELIARRIYQVLTQQQQDMRLTPLRNYFNEPTRAERGQAS